MKMITRTALLACALALLSAPMAAAQVAIPEGKIFASVNVASQSAERSFDETRTWSLYEETASFSGSHKVSGGSFVDIGGGVRLWQGLGVGLAFSTMSDSADVPLAAQIPNPLFVNRPRSTSASAKGLEHKTTAVHLQAMYMIPLMKRVLITVSAGPTFFSVKQDRVENIELGAESLPYTSIGISRVSTVNTSTSKSGFNVGADVSYYFTKMVGAGVYFRHAATSIDLPAPLAGGNAVTLDVGGFQVGGGLRIRF